MFNPTLHNYQLFGLQEQTSTLIMPIKLDLKHYLYHFSILFFFYKVGRLLELVALSCVCIESHGQKNITKENKFAYVKLEEIMHDQLDHLGIV